MKIIAIVTVALTLCAPARAIELSLEENRAERGSVGFVDMQRLFTNSPDAQRAKEGFEELVRQAGERVNLRKAELLRLRQELDSRRMERDALSASSAAAAAVAPPAAVVPPAPLVSAPALSSSTPLSAPVAPALVAASTTTPVLAKGIALPGMGPSDFAPAAPPASSATAASPLLPPMLTLATSTAAVPAVVVSSAAAPAPAPIGPSYAQRLLEVDGKIISLQADIARKEAELVQEHDEADHGLLDVESRKTDQVLARLYRAVTEVAHREGVSVVIDKTTVLYGHPAVDITDKVLKYLKEATPP